MSRTSTTPHQDNAGLARVTPPRTTSASRMSLASGFNRRMQSGDESSHQVPSRREKLPELFAMRKHIDVGYLGPGGTAPTSRGSHQPGTSGQLPDAGAGESSASLRGGATPSGSHYLPPGAKLSEGRHPARMGSFACGRAGMGCLPGRRTSAVHATGSGAAPARQTCEVVPAMKGESLREVPTISRRPCECASPGILDGSEPSPVYPEPGW